MFPKIILNKSENRCTPILVRTVLDSCYGRAARRVYIPRRNAAKREKEGRGGAGQGGGRGGRGILSGHVRANSHSVVIVYDATTNAREQRRARFSAGPFLGTICTGYSSRFPPFRETRNESLSSLRSCGEKKEKEKGKGGREGESDFSNDDDDDDDRGSIFPSTSMCVRVVVD